MDSGVNFSIWSLFWFYVDRVKSRMLARGLIELLCQVSISQDVTFSHWIMKSIIYLANQDGSSWRKFIEVGGWVLVAFALSSDFREFVDWGLESCEKYLGDGSWSDRSLFFFWFSWIVLIF